MLQSIATAVKDRGWAFAAVFPADAQRHQWFEEMRATGVELHVVSDSRPRSLVSWLTQELGDRDERTLLHTHFSTFDIASVVAARIHRSTPVVWHLHSALRSEPATVAKNFVRFALFGRLAARIVCVGPEIRDKALTRLAPARRTQLLENGIALERFAPVTPAERSAARERLALPADAQVLLLFGWDWDVKGGPLLIEALAKLRDRQRQVTAVIVGSATAARAAADEAGCGDSIRCLPPQDDPRALYAAADVFVAASPAEGMPFSLLEALACGTPVVASDIVSHRYVGADLPACTLASRLASAFAAALAQELDADPRERQARLRATRAIIERERSLSTWSARVMDLYDEILSL